MDIKTLLMMKKGGGSSGGGGGNSGGGGSVVGVSPKAVNFRDYDGTVLHSYTKEEALALKALPELPTRAGLICQEWNWSLEDMQSYVADYGICEVGATYITDDGKTRLYITIATEGRMDVSFFLEANIKTSMTINWGDGSSSETVEFLYGKTFNHTYASVGDYVITVEVPEGSSIKITSNGSSYSIMGKASETGLPYCNMLRKVEIGNSVTSIDEYAFYNCRSLESIVIPNSVTNIYNYAFKNCYSLTSIVIPNGVPSVGMQTFVECHSLASIVIPNGVTNIYNNAFDDCHSLASIVIPNSVTSISGSAFVDCHSLASIVIPNGVTSIGSTVFSKCYSLSSITIPNSVTSIGSEGFSNCESLASITIPNSVTSIGSNLFYYCRGMAFYDFTNHTTIPALTGTNAFSSIPSDCEIRVPAVLAEEWKVATNWSTYASKIVGV